MDKRFFGFVKALFVVIICMIFTACSKDGEDIDRVTSGEVSTHVAPFITFKKDVVDSKETRGVYDEKFKLNNDEISAKYSFSTTNTLRIILKGQLNANTDYTLEVPLEKIAKDRKADIKSKKAILKFKTNPNTLKIDDMQFIQNDKNKDYVNLVITLDSNPKYDIATLQNATKLVDSKNNNIDFDVKYEGEDEYYAISNKNKAIITSKPLKKLDSGEETYTITLDSKMLGLKNDVISSKMLLNSNEMSIDNIKAVSGEYPSIDVYFSNELKQENNLKDFVKISPQVDFSVAQSGRVLHINGKFQTNTNYEIKILKGLKSSKDVALKEDYDSSVEIKDMASKIVFSSSGVFLPPSESKKVSFKSMNVDRVNVKVSKIYPNNITQFLYNSELSGGVRDYYDIYFNINRLGDEVFNKDYDIKDNKKNTWIQSQVDLSNIKDSNGIFIVEISPKDSIKDTKSSGVMWFGEPLDTAEESTQDYEEEEFYDSFNSKAIRKNLIFSNIALIAQKGDDKLTISALNISNNALLSGVKISAINSKNQVVASGTTNVNGDLILNLKKQEVLYLLAEQGVNKTILKLREASSLNDAGYDISGNASSNGFNAFIYTDRGVYRPGDSVHLNVIARKDNAPLSKEHPILLSIIDSKNKQILKDQSVAQVSDGMYYYKLETPKSANTGVWNVVIDIGGNRFYKKISIETILPDRIKVDIKAADMDLKENKILKIALQGDYLFGAPASDLVYQSKVYVKSEPFKSTKYAGYIFGNNGVANYKTQKDFSGNLDSKGYMESSIDLSDIASTDGNLKAIITAKVYEKSQRFTKVAKEIKLKQYDSFVGIGDTNTQVLTNTEISLPLIVLDSKEEILPNRILEYRIYNNTSSWWWDYDYNYSHKSIKSDKDTQLIAQGEITTSNKPVFLKHTFKQRGDILIEVTDKQSGATSAISLYASEYGEPLNPNNITSLNISTDKKEYNVKDVAKINFESSSNSKALITISKEGKILKRFWKSTKGGENIVEIPLESSYAPNVYASVSLLQDYNNTNDRALRLYGVVPLIVKDSNTLLKLNIDAPKEILPNSDFEVKISNDDKKQATYTIAIVDSGLLSIDNFQSPNAWKYFYSKLALGLKSYDTYDLVINKTFGKVHNILKAGGDGGSDEDDDLSLLLKKDENAERFKPVVLYSAPAKTDSNGNATLKFKMPSYIGNVRVMVVATNDKMLGSASSDIKVSAPVVMLPSLPRALKVNDKFSLPIEVFRTKDSVKSASVSIKSKNGLVTFDKASVNVEFDKKDSISVAFDGVVKDSIGIEDIDIALKSSEFSMNDSTQIDVKAINPYIQQTQKSLLESNKTLKLDAPKGYVLNSNTGYIEISSVPLIALNHRLNYLMNYPYGCVEQTTSSVMPQLFLQNLTNSKYVDKDKINTNINAAILKLQRFQTYDGGFAYWQGGKQADRWGSNYAGHFLLLAKNKGYSINDSVLKQWINYQINAVKSEDSNMDRIYSLYLLALSNNAQIGIMNTIYENDLNSLNITQKWLLAAAYNLSGNKDIAQKITKNLSITPDTSKNEYIYTYGSSMRDSAIILMAYNAIYGKVSESILEYLTKEIESKSWHSTQELGYSLLALGTLKDNNKDSVIKGEISINNKKQEFNEIARSIRYDFDSGSASITSSSPNTLYVIQYWQGVQTGEMKEDSKNLILKREFLDDSGKAIDVASLKSGSSFWLKIDVESKLDSSIYDMGLPNVALEQGLPSGWEIENLRLNILGDSNDLDSIESNGDSYGDAPINSNNGVLNGIPSFVRMENVDYTDIRDDKIIWFFSLNGTKSVFAKINVVTPGKYTLPPASAQAMYDNNYEANTKSMSVEVTK